MDIRLESRLLAGTVAAVSSKSQLHRLLICALMAEGETTISFRGLSEDIMATIGCIRALGKAVTVTDGHITVAAGRRDVGTPSLDCGESGTTARLLLPVAAALADGFVMTGHGRLPERPMAELCRAMEGAGVTLSSQRLPLEAAGRLSPGTFRLPGNVSSQYISGLLLALPALLGDSHIALTTSLSSAAYVDMTRRAMRMFGVGADIEHIPGGQTYVSPGTLAAEGDWSNAAAWLCAPGVTVTGLDPESCQGDRGRRDSSRKFVRTAILKSRSMRLQTCCQCWRLMPQSGGESADLQRPRGCASRRATGWKQPLPSSGVAAARPRRGRTP